ncbi:MAG: Cys-tRNA(Pro) deacylase [Clostridia bacterium]|nr:Cys-tRNA(Pro) deacylase [Clostridia bacterium]
MNKTNAMRLLDKAKIAYKVAEYAVDESDLSGTHIADSLGLSYSGVFKTLVAKGDKTGILVFCIPVDKTLDMKKIATISGNKKVEMIEMKQLLPLTGYIRGGCSPIGMKKKYKTFIDESCLDKAEISVSAGVRGGQIILAPRDLIAYTEAETASLT